MTCTPTQLDRSQANRRWGAAVLALLVLLALPIEAPAADDMSDGEVAVDSARRGLARGPNIPWYDPETDDFRAAKVKPPPRQQSWNPNFGFLEFIMYLGWLALALVLVYLVYLIVRAFMQSESRSTLRVEQVAAAADIARVEELPVALAKSPADYLEEAQRLYRRGDYAQAIVYLFSHQLLSLDRRHWVRLVKGKTNRQYLREVRRSAAPSAERLADLFQGTVLLFEEVFFGKRLPPQASLDATWGDIAEFEALVAEPQEQAA